MRGIEKRNLAKSQNPNPRETPRLKRRRILTADYAEGSDKEEL
jgi:hypothetical protein